MVLKNLPDDVDYLDLARRINDFLESTFVAVLATNEEQDGVWATPIYFTYDNKFNFYFMSDSRTRHIKDIEYNPNVSLAIILPLNNSVGFKVGLQIEGRAQVVPDDQIEEIYMQRSMRLTGIKTWNKESRGGHLIKQTGGVFIKIVPTAINFTDRRYAMGDSIKISIKKLIQSSNKVRTEIS